MAVTLKCHLTAAVCSQNWGDERWKITVHCVLYNFSRKLNCSRQTREFYFMANKCRIRASLRDVSSEAVLTTRAHAGSIFASFSPLKSKAMIIFFISDFSQAKSFLLVPRSMFQSHSFSEETMSHWKRKHIDFGENIRVLK